MALRDATDVEEDPMLFDSFSEGGVYVGRSLAVLAVVFALAFALTRVL